MKYSFAIAALFAVATVSGVSLSAEPVGLKKEEPKKDEAAIQAKFDALKEKKEAADEKAKENEAKAMEAEEKDVERKKKAYQTAYWGHIKDQNAETQRIRDLRERPKGASNPDESHDVTGGLTKAEHWVTSMPDHILDNKEGPTAAWDSPAPPKKEASKEPANTGK